MQPGDYTQVIYDRGCLRSGEEWVERNLVPVAAVAVALAVLQARKFSPVCHSVPKSQESYERGSKVKLYIR